MGGRALVSVEPTDPHTRGEWTVNKGTLHLKSRQRRREIYFPKYIYIFVLSIEKRLGMNCPNLGKIIVRRWSDNFTRLSEVLHEVVQMWSIHFLKDAEYRDIIGKNNSSQWLDIFPKC